MPRRDSLIALVFLEALLWFFVTGTLFVPGLRMLSPFGAVFGSVQVTLVQVVNIGALALAFIVGMRSRTWQGAIALNLIASAPAVLLTTLTYHLESNVDMALLYLVAPLAALGWCGWLLRFVRAELAD